MTRVQRLVSVVADTVMRRVEAGEQTAVRWQRERRRRFDPIEDDSLARKPIEHRRRRAHVSIQAKTIGSRGIKRDETMFCGPGS